MKKNYHSPTGLFCLLFCLASFYAQASADKYELSDTIHSLVHQRNRISVLKVNNKVNYRMQKVPANEVIYSDESNEVLRIDSGVIRTERDVTLSETDVRLARSRNVASSGSGNYYPNAVDCQGSVFAGKDRALVKTHIVSGHLNKFSNLNDLFASALIIPDETMRNGESGVKKDPDGERVDLEKKSIVISQAFIYGIYRESDNDFHIIIGNGLAGNKRKLFNIEVSGMPGDAPGSSLKTPRQAIIARFGDIKCSDGAFKPVDKLIPISIKGSLFYDIDHPPGHVGFGNYKPTTAWEIHPVQQIKFLD